MSAKKSQGFSYEIVTRRLVMPEDLNPNHSIFGGKLLAWMDVDLYLFAAEKTKITNMVTVAMEKVYFKNPAYLGEVIEITAAISRVRRSAITIHGKAEAHDPKLSERRLIIECEITYVALDSEGRPAPALKDFKVKR